MAETEEELVALARTVKPRKPDLEQELGVPTAMPYSMSFRETAEGEYLAPNTALISLDRLIEMRQKDGTIRALLRLYQLPILKSMKEATWVEPDEGGAEKETQFANDMFTLPSENGGMTVSMTRVIRNTLLALLEGFSVFEQVRYVPDTGPNKGKIVLKKLAHRDARTIEFVVDDHGGFNGVRQTAPKPGQTMDRVKIDKENCWYYAVNEEENPHYGVSMFEAAWHHWDHKRKLYYISHVAAQMAATQGRMGKIPPNATPEEIRGFKKMLAEFGFNTSGTFKEGYDVQFTNMNTNFEFITLINHQNQQMAKSVLAKFMEDEGRQVLIENAKGDASADFFVMAVESVMAEIAESWKKYLLPQYIDYNFGTGKYPIFRFGVISDATRDVIKELFSIVATAQSSKWTDEFVRELEKKLTDRLGLEVDYDEVKQREEEAAAEQARLTEAYYAQRGGGAAAGGGAPAEEAAPEEGEEEVAASAIGGAISLSRIMDRVEHLILAKRESDLDAGS
jgi:hypothetical protein